MTITLCLYFRYARAVLPGTTQSQWPEYAVKVIDVQKIQELSYTQSIDREIAILRTLLHPGESIESTTFHQYEINRTEIIAPIKALFTD